MMQRHFRLAMDGVSDDIPPLRRAAALVDDDLCLMERRETRLDPHRRQPVRPSFFSAEEAVGKSLAELHGRSPASASVCCPRGPHLRRPGRRLHRRAPQLERGRSGELFLPDSAPVEPASP